MNLIHGEEVHGSGVYAQTRCSHYKSEIDVIAIKFKCCGDWFPHSKLSPNALLIRREFGIQLNTKHARFCAEFADIN